MVVFSIIVCHTSGIHAYNGFRYSGVRFYNNMFVKYGQSIKCACLCIGYTIPSVLDKHANHWTRIIMLKVQLTSELSLIEIYTPGLIRLRV